MTLIFIILLDSSLHQFVGLLLHLHIFVIVMEVVEINRSVVFVFPVFLKTKFCESILVSGHSFEVIIQKDLVFHFFGLELEKALYSKHMVCLEEFHKILNYHLNYVFNLSLIISDLHILLSFSTDIDVLHELIAVGRHFHEVVKNLECG